MDRSLLNLYFPVKTGPVAGVAGYPRLPDINQERVHIAVIRYGFYMLEMARRFAFHPIFFP
jgi:hypothetical protein